MAKARQCEQWNHTASLLAMMFNTAVGKKRAQRMAGEFHPFIARRRTAPRRRLTAEETERWLDRAVGA